MSELDENIEWARSLVHQPIGISEAFYALIALFLSKKLLTKDEVESLMKEAAANT